jgi:hypothetical protein
MNNEAIFSCRVATPPLLRSGPEPLDPVAVGVDPLRTGDGGLFALGGDRWTRALLLDVLPEGMAGIASISHDHLGAPGKRSRSGMA